MYFFKYLKSVSAKNCPRYFQICKFAFLNFWKGVKQKIGARLLLDLYVYFFKYLKSVWAKNCRRFFQVWKYGFLNIWKGDEQKLSYVFLYLQVNFFKYLKNITKNCPRYFKICKCALLTIWKVDKQKIVLAILRFASILFWIFKKCIREKLLGSFQI